MRHYEIVFIVHPDQSEQVPAMIERYRNTVTGRQGKIHRLEDWGRRQLTYPDREDPQGALRADEHRVRQRDADRAGSRLQVQRRCAPPPHGQDERAGDGAFADDEGRESKIRAASDRGSKEAAKKAPRRRRCRPRRRKRPRRFIESDRGAGVVSSDRVPGAASRHKLLSCDIPTGLRETAFALDRCARRSTLHPGGAGCNDFSVAHRSHQVEAGAERRVELEIACIAVEDLARRSRPRCRDRPRSRWFPGGEGQLEPAARAACHRVQIQRGICQCPLQAEVKDGRTRRKDPRGRERCGSRQLVQASQILSLHRREDPMGRL